MDQAIERGEIRPSDRLTAIDAAIRQSLDRPETTATGGRVPGISIEGILDAINARKAGTGTVAAGEEVEPTGERLDVPRKVDEKPLTTTEAVKVTSLIAAREEWDFIRAGVFDENGEVNEFNVATMTANVPFTKGRTLRQAFQRVLEPIIRAESAAAVPNTEIVRLAQRFRPHVTDTDEAIRIKMERIQNLLDGTLSLVEFGRGVFSNSTIKKLEAMDSGITGRMRRASASRASSATAERLKKKYNLE